MSNIRFQKLISSLAFIISLVMLTTCMGASWSQNDDSESAPVPAVEIRLAAGPEFKLATGDQAQKSHVLDSHGQPQGAVVFSVLREDLPGRLLMPINGNMPRQVGVVPLRIYPVDRYGDPLDGPRESEKLLFGTGSVTVAETKEKATVDLATSAHAHFALSDKGNEAAFVPPNAKGPIRLRPCGKLKLLPASKKVADESCNVVIVWKNCLAGSYPLLHHQSPESTPLDWRLFPYFEITTVIENVSTSKGFESELYLPPGEVTISVLTDKQLVILNQFKPDYVKMTRRLFPTTCGIHTIVSSETTEVPIQLGTCLSGDIVPEKTSPIPNWGKTGSMASLLRFHPADLEPLKYELVSSAIDKSGLRRLPKVELAKERRAQKYEEFARSADKIVEQLTTDEGKRFRIQNQAGVITAFVDADGKFATVPLPQGVYVGHLKKWAKSPIGAYTPKPTANGVTENKGRHGVLSSTSLNSSPVVDYFLHAKDFNSGGPIEHKFVANTDKSLLYESRLFSTPRSSLKLSPSQYLKAMTTGNQGFNGTLALRMARRALAYGESETAWNIMVRLKKQKSVDYVTDGDTLEQVDAIVKRHFELLTLAQKKQPSYNTEAKSFLLEQAFALRKYGDVEAASKVEAQVKKFLQLDSSTSSAEKAALEFLKSKVSQTSAESGLSKKALDSKIAELTKEIAKQFDAKQEQRAAELNQLEGKIKTARQKLTQREADREAIISRRVQKLLSEHGIKDFESEN